MIALGRQAQIGTVGLSARSGAGWAGNFELFAVYFW